MDYVAIVICVLMFIAGVTLLDWSWTIMHADVRDYLNQRGRR